MRRPGLIPRFYANRYPGTQSRRSLDWVDNGVTRSINVEWGQRQYQAVWTRKAYRSDCGCCAYEES